MKKILSILLAMCMLFAMFALPATAADTVTCVLHIGDTTQEISGAVGDVIKFPMPLKAAADMGKHFVTWCTDEACENPLTADVTFAAGETVHYYAWLKDFDTYHREDFDSTTKGDTVIQYGYDHAEDGYRGYTMPLYNNAISFGTGVAINTTNYGWQDSHIFLKDVDGTYVSAAPNTTYHMEIRYRATKIGTYKNKTGKVAIHPVFGLNTQYVGKTNMSNAHSVKTTGAALDTLTAVSADWVTKTVDFTTGDVLNTKEINGVELTYDKWAPNIGFRLFNSQGASTTEVDYIVVQTYKTVKFSYINGEETVVEGKLYGDAIEYPTLADGAKWSLDPNKYVAVPETVGEDSITVYEYNENTAERYTINFVYANGETETKQYVEGATIVYPELDPSTYNTADIVWSKAADSYVAVPETMGAEEITVYEYANPVMGFENYNTNYWNNSNWAGGKAPNNMQVTDEKAYSGKYSMRFQDLNVQFLTSEPSDWSTKWTSYYEYDAETNSVTQLASATAPAFEENKYCKQLAYNNVAQGSFFIPVDLGKSSEADGTPIALSYKYKVTFKYYLVNAKSGGFNLYWKQVDHRSTYFKVNEVDADHANYQTSKLLTKNQWTEFTAILTAEELTGSDKSAGQYGIIMHVYDAWGKGTVGKNNHLIYFDDIKVEPIIEEVNVKLNRYTTAGDEVETLTGKPGDALTLPATNFFMDENWYTADGEVYTGTVFPDEELNLYTAGAFVDEEDSTTIGANFDVVKDGNDHVIYYAGTDAQVTGKDNALAIGAVEDYKTYKVAVTYKANGGNLGFNAYTAQADNMLLGTMPVNGAYTGNIYAVTESTNGEYTTAVFYISTDLYGEYTTVAGKEDTKTSNANQLYLTVQDTGASELYIKDIAVTAVDGIAADGAAKLTDADAEEAGEQAIRFFFDYKYAIENDKLYVVLGSDKYELVGRGFIYMNGNNQAIGVDNAFTLNSAYENMVVTYKDTDLNQCWSFTADEMTFSTYVRGITDELADDEIMIKGYVKVLVDGQEMVIYSNTISRSVAGVEANI